MFYIVFIEFIIYIYYMMKLIICLLICFFALSSFQNSAHAVGRGLACAFTGGAGMATDGSTCDLGLTCDPKVKICANSSDMACSGVYPCAVGQSCIGVNGGNFIKPDGAGVAGGVGFCITADGNSETNAFGQALCNMFKFITGKVGRGVAAGAVIALGVFFFMGKVTWGSALAVALGVGAVFGAPSVVSVLTGKSFDC